MKRKRLQWLIAVIFAFTCRGDLQAAQKLDRNPAKVLKAWYGLHLVRYDGYEASADEWVGPTAIRLRTE